jgi:hypothetical protein
MKREWNEVLRVIKKMAPDLPGMKAEEKLIAKTPAKGKVVMHYSKHYKKIYHPHYRTIHRTIY